MRYYIGFILSILGIVLILFFKYPEFSSVLKAKESYNLGDYKTAAEIYKSLNLPKAKYNEGVANYKDGNFSESLQNFNEVKDDNLSFETLHNLGNTYANLHDFNKSISSFKKALEIKDDNDTRFNLELVEKIQDQNKTQNNQNSSDNNNEQNQDKNQNSNQNSDNNSEQNNQNNSEQNSQNSKDENKQNKNQQNSDKQNSEKNEQQNDKQNDNKSNENQEDKNNQENKQNNDKEENKQNENSNIAQKSIENEQKEDENKENQNIGKQVENKKDDKIDEIPADIKPISDMEEAKWQKALEHRNIGTFLMPIGEKNHKNEDKNVKPW